MAGPEPAIHLHARAADRPRDGGRAVTGRVQSSDPVVIETALAARGDAVVLRPLDALALPLLDEAALDLRNHAQHGQDEVAHLAAGRDVLTSPPFLIQAELESASDPSAKIQRTR